jgi:hypothetical protein
VKKQYAAVLLAVCAVLSLAAQEAPGAPSVQTISRQLNSFSPLGEIYVRDLGMTDKNHNGVIDKDAGEGYEEFSARYGDADIGFAANGVTYGAANGRLEEPEIVNHYYLNIRFKNPVETTTIESEVSAYIYANNIPLVWLDDEQGTVMNAVNKALGEGWNEKEVAEDEAVRMFHRAMEGMRIRGRTGDPAKTGYYTLPEFVNRKTGYCFEIAQFGFFMASKLRITSSVVTTPLTEVNLHDTLQLHPSTQIFDFFHSAPKNPVWRIENPMQSISYTLLTSARKRLNSSVDQSIELLNQAVTYNKYDITTTALLMQTLLDVSSSNYELALCLGESILEKVNITGICAARHIEENKIKTNLKILLQIMIEGYGRTKNKEAFNKIEALLTTYYANDLNVLEHIAFYKLLIK